MNWFKSSYGWLIALLLYTLIIWNLAGRYFRREPAPKGVVVDTTRHQPDFVVRESGGFLPPKTTIKDLARGSSAIDTLTQTEHILPPGDDKPSKPDTVQIPCRPFSLRLVSRGFRPVLDSTVLNYSYPSGLAEWTYFGGTQREAERSSPRRAAILSLKADVRYWTWQSGISSSVFLAVHLRNTKLEGGYRLLEHSRPSWFAGVSQELKVF